MTLSLKATIEAFEVSCDGNKTLFLEKLASENGWSSQYARRAFVEYKRFLYLACVSDLRMVPSATVDVVWHLHMTFTRSYWHDLCAGVLGKELHHVPSPLNDESAQKDRRDYGKTLERYKTTFGEYPPKAYWGKIKPKNTGVEKVVFLGLMSTILLTACSSIPGDDIVFYLKCALGIYIVYKVLKWLGPGSGGRGGCSGSSCSSCGGD